MTDKIIGKKVFIVTSMWTANEGYYEKPKVYTTMRKAFTEMKKQVKDFVSNYNGDVDIEEFYSFVSNADIDDCSWTINVTELS